MVLDDTARGCRGFTVQGREEIRLNHTHVKSNHQHGYDGEYVHSVTAEDAHLFRSDDCNGTASHQRSESCGRIAM